MSEERSASSLPRPVLAAVIALSVVLVAGVAVVGLTLGSRQDPAQNRSTAMPTGNRTGPLALPPIPAPAATSADCTKLVAALPAELSIGTDKLTRRQLVAPEPPATLAWGSPQREPVTLRCGLDRPEELTPTSQLLDVSTVQWLELKSPDSTSISWVSVDRPVYVVVTLPENSGTAPLQDISGVIRTALPAKQIDAGTLTTTPEPTR